MLLLRCRLSSVGQSDALVMRRSRVRFPEAAPKIKAPTGKERSGPCSHSTLPEISREAWSHSGASYTVAPGFDSNVMMVSFEAGLPHLPGVATPSEVQKMWS